MVNPAIQYVFSTIFEISGIVVYIYFRLADLFAQRVILNFATTIGHAVMNTGANEIGFMIVILGDFPVGLLPLLSLHVSVTHTRRR